jgi:hypothetical protein
MLKRYQRADGTRGYLPHRSPKFGEPVTPRKRRGAIFSMGFPCAVSLLLGAALALGAGSAAGEDPTSRALLQRQQQSDAFSLQLQQSIQTHRSGSLTPQQRLELETLQRDQRLLQSDTFYRQMIEQGQPRSNGPENAALRRAEALRMEQDRQRELTRFREETARQVERSRTSPPAPLPEPTIVR